jgi:hypothetical protein
VGFIYTRISSLSDCERKTTITTKKMGDPEIIYWSFIIIIIHSSFKSVSSLPAMTDLNHLSVLGFDHKDCRLMDFEHQPGAGQPLGSFSLLLSLSVEGIAALLAGGGIFLMNTKYPQ